MIRDGTTGFQHDSALRWYIQLCKSANEKQESVKQQINAIIGATLYHVLL